MIPIEPPFDKAFTDKVHRDATALCEEITGYFYNQKIQINEIIFVPMIIFARIIRLRDAALTLTSGGFPTEAGILVLSQFEAKLDLVQAARDVQWAASWLGHRNTKQSVTKNMTDAICRVFSEEQEQSVERSIFRYLSAIKHGNPASSELGFQVRRIQTSIVVSTGELADATTRATSAMIGDYATYQLAWAAQGLNVTTGRYARCSPTTTQAVQENRQRISEFAKLFNLFLASWVEGRAGHLDIASRHKR